MSSCNHCQAELYTDSIAGVRNLRCAKCNHLNSFVGKSQTNQNRDAWFSLWLGLSSMLLICVTGIPALFFGIRALAKMRYHPTSSRAKTATIVGLAAGFVGTFVIGLFAAFVGLIGYFIVSTKPIDDPAQLAANINRIGTFVRSDVPNIQPRRSTPANATNFEFIVWTDDRLDSHWLCNEKPRSVYLWNEQNRTTRILVSRFPKWLEINLIELKKQLRDMDLHEKEKRRQTGNEHLTWKFVGEETQISKISFEEILKTKKQADNGTEPATPIDADDAKTEPAKMILYCCLEIRNKNGYAFGLIHDPEKSNLTEAQIRTIFESFEPTTKQ